MNKRLKSNDKQFLYKKIAQDISKQILKGTLKCGDRLPTVRKLSKDLGISVNTVLNSYTQLESLGLIEARPQSGYYVRSKSEKIMNLTAEQLIEKFLSINKITERM